MRFYGRTILRHHRCPKITISIKLLIKISSGNPYQNQNKITYKIQSMSQQKYIPQSQLTISQSEPFDQPEILKVHSRSELSTFSPILIDEKKEDNDEIEMLLRTKISMYMATRPTLGRLTPIIESKLKEQKKTVKTSKLFTSSLDMPRIPNLPTLLSKQKQIHHIYRQKIDNSFQQCFLFYMQILSAAIKYEYKISHIEIDREKSILIDSLLYIANTLVEIGGVDRLAFYFCVKGIRLCEIYGRMREIGELMFLMAAVMRKMQRFDDCVLFLKKALEYIWRNRNEETNQKQIQIYNLISQCLLQTNQPEQSKIFAYKYQIGYLQKNNSKIIELSHELIDSVQNRKSKWHSVTKQSMELLLEFDIEEFVRNNAAALMRLDQKKIVELMKINFQFLYEGFKADDMFFYQIPMPLEIVNDTKKVVRKKVNETKFLVKKRSASVGSLHKTPVKLLKAQHEKPKEFIIFNYRGVGVSKQKLCQLFKDFVRKIKTKLQMK